MSLTEGSKGITLSIIAEHIRFMWLLFLASRVSKGFWKTRVTEKEYFKEWVSETCPWPGKLDVLGVR